MNPADTAALARLVQLQYSAANANTDSNGAPTSEGEQHLQEAADAWNKYVKVSNGNPNPSTAVYALNTFDLLGQAQLRAGSQRHQYRRRAHRRDGGGGLAGRPPRRPSRY